MGWIKSRPAASQLDIHLCKPLFDDFPTKMPNLLKESMFIYSLLNPQHMETGT